MVCSSTLYAQARDSQASLGHDFFDGGDLTTLLDDILKQFALSENVLRTLGKLDHAELISIAIAAISRLSSEYVKSTKSSLATPVNQSGACSSAIK